MYPTMLAKTSVLSKLVKKLKHDPLSSLICEYFLVRDHAPDRLKTYCVPINMSAHIPGRLRPSSIGGCPRRAVFSFVGIKPRRLKDVAMEKIFWRGSWIHHEWQATFMDMERVLGGEKFKVLAIEEPVTYEPLMIKGRLDAKVAIWGEASIIDFKSVSSYSYTHHIHNGPADEHIWQLHAYQAATRIDQGAILYDNKEDQSLFRAYPVRFNGQVWGRVKKWCLQVLGFVDKKALPPMHPQCTRGSWLQRGCPYAGLCYGDYSADRLEEMAFGGRRSSIDGSKAWWNLGIQLEKKMQPKKSHP